jgi:ribose 5-phosphate isomerase B
MQILHGNTPNSSWHFMRQSITRYARFLIMYARISKGRLNLRIAIASDHAALDMKAALSAHMRMLGNDVIDLGPNDTTSVDYPDYGYKLAEAVASGAADRGVVLCGSGIGISIAVNRNPACRAALVSEPLSAALARAHNDANVIAMGARILGIEMATACVDAFLNTEFGGDRHVRRVGKLSHPPTLKVSV